MPSHPLRVSKHFSIITFTFFMHVLVFSTCLPMFWFNLFTFCLVYPQYWSTCSLWRTILSHCLPFSTRLHRVKAFTSSAIGSALRKCTVSATPSAAVTRPSLRQHCHPNRDNWWELDHCRRCCAHTRCWVCLILTLPRRWCNVFLPTESHH